MKDGWGASYTRQSWPSHAEKRQRMGQGSCLCHFDIAPQDEVSMGAAKAALSVGLATHSLPPLLATSYPVTEEDDSSWSLTSENSWLQHSHGFKCESFVTPTNKGEKWEQWKGSSLPRHRPGEAIPGKGCNVREAYLAYVHPHMPCHHGIYNIETFECLVEWGIRLEEGPQELIQFWRF